nr:hypothetical protein [Pseudomonadota bacterium]
SLTGLIGERGAVGVFVSDRDIMGREIQGAPFAGGFVVDNPNESPECSADKPRNLFNLDLCPSPECSREAGDPPCPNPLGEARRDICKERGDNGVNLPTGVTESDCNTPELVGLICSATAAPLDPLCTDDLYDYSRQLVCGGQDVNNPEQSLCAPVIAKLCEAEPFNQNAGAGANKFDCTSVNSKPVVDARKARITLCLATPNDPLCKQGDVSATLATCAERITAIPSKKDKRRDRICTEDGVRAALTVCADNPDDPICIADDVSATLASCADNPRGLICTRGVTGILSACDADDNTQLCREGADEIVNFCRANRGIAICSTPGLVALLACKDRIVTASRACQRENASAVLAACANAPNEPLCTQEGVSAIVSACVAARANESPQFPLSSICQLRGVPVVLATCAADPFDAACTDVAEQYTQARNTRLETCGGKPSTRVDVKCDNARPTLCAEGGTPFAQICEGYDTTQAT